MADRSMPTGFQVEPDAATHAAERIASAMAEVAERRASSAVAALSAEATGHAGLAQALSTFTDAWHEALDAWTERGTATAMLLHATATNYTTTDQTNAEEFAPTDCKGAPKTDGLGSGLRSRPDPIV